MRITTDLDEKVVEKIDELAGRIFDGTRNNFLNYLVNSQETIKIDEEVWLITDLLKLPKIDLTVLRFDTQASTALKSPFKKNFYKLPFKYRYRIFKLLYLYTNGKTDKNELRYKSNFLGVAKNLSLYYQSGFRNLYMNINGIGPDSADKYLRGIGKPFRQSNEKQSPIFISRLERFISDRFIKPGEPTLFDEISELLNVDESIHNIQLSTSDLDLLINYYEQIFEFDYHV